MRLNYGKTFLLGFGFFGVAVIWAVYNGFVSYLLVGILIAGEVVFRHFYKRRLGA